MAPYRFISTTLAFHLLLLTCGGCGDLIPPRPPIKRDLSQSESTTPADATETQTTDPAIAETDEDREYEGDWNATYVHRFGSQIVGVTEVSAKSKLDLDRLLDEPSEVDYRRSEQLVFRAGSVSFLRRLELSSTERTSGELLRFESTVTTGPVIAKTSGGTSKGTLSIRTNENGVAEKSQLKFSETVRSLFALEQTLRRRPIDDGETRRVTMLLPSLRSVGVIELRCNGDASVAMLDGDYKRLKEVDVMTFQDGTQVDSIVIWINDQGVIEKTLRPQVRLETILTERGKARSLFKRAGDRSVTMAVAGTLPREGAPRQTTFVLQWPTNGKSDSQDVDLTTLAPTIANQTASVTDEQLEVRVTSELVPDAPHAEITEGDIAATALIDSKNPRVVRLAGAIGDLPNAKLAEELMYVVHNSLSLAPQGEMRSASSIVRAAAGGAIDHAIVLTALLRSRGISARVAFGLVPQVEAAEEDPSVTQMVLTAWVVAMPDGRWIALDPTRKRINAADQLCLQVCSADADLPLEFAGTFRRLMQMRVEIGSSDPQ